MFKRGNCWIVLLVIVLLFPSCATILTGTNQQVKVNPSKEVVYVNEVAQESKDSLVKVRRKLFNKNRILVKSESDETVKYKSKFNEVSLLNFIILPFWIVDLITGSVVKYDNQNK